MEISKMSHLGPPENKALDRFYAPFYKSHRWIHFSGRIAGKLRGTKSLSMYIMSLLFALSLFSCQSDASTVEQTGKPKILWFDSEANFKRFSTQDSIVFYLDRAKETGFNEIVVDVRPVQGDVLYRSDLLDPLTGFDDDFKFERDWDYLDFFLTEAKKRDLKVTVSASILPAGLTETQSGPAFRDSSWDKQLTVGYTPEGLKNMKEMDYLGVFLSPHLHAVRQLVTDYVTEIVSRYPFDSFALDYCRFADPRFDFSDSARLEFEKYIGHQVDKFPEDIFTYRQDGTREPGKYYRDWWEFRAMTIRDLVSHLRTEIKNIQPDIKLTYWAGSWIHAIYGNGQNWAGPGRYDPWQQQEEWASPNYTHAGFADQLDIFMVGAYLPTVHGPADPESIEFALERAKRLIGDDCLVYGSIYGLSNRSNMADAVEHTLGNSAGLMVFDIVQVIEYDLWDEIEEGISRVESPNNQKQSL